MTTSMTNMTTNTTSQETGRQETCHQELLIFKLILMRTFPKPLLLLSHIFPTTGSTLICTSLKLVATLTDDAIVSFCCVSFLFPWKSNARITISIILMLTFFPLKNIPWTSFHKPWPPWMISDPETF